MRNRRPLHLAAAMLAALLAWGCRALEEEAVIRITPEGTFAVEISSRMRYDDEYFKPDDIERRDAVLRDYGNGADAWTLRLLDAGAREIRVDAGFTEHEGEKRLASLHRSALLNSAQQLDKLFAQDALAFRIADDTRRGLRAFEVIAYARPAWSREEAEILDVVKKNLPAASEEFFKAIDGLYRHWSAHPERRERFRFFFDADGDPEKIQTRTGISPGAMELGFSAALAMAELYGDPEETTPENRLNQEEMRLLAVYTDAAADFFEFFELTDGATEAALEKCCPASIAVRVIPPEPPVEVQGFSAWEALENEMKEEERREAAREYRLCPPSPLEAPLLMLARMFSPSPMHWRTGLKGEALAAAGFRASLPPEGELRKAVERALEFVPLYRLAWPLPAAKEPPPQAAEALDAGPGVRAVGRGLRTPP